MFAGIITNTGIIHKITKQKKSCVIEIKSNMKFSKKSIGSSICCSGACLTLESYKSSIGKYFLSLETLNRTNFKYSKRNDLINLEKSLKYGERLSGHFVQGHVDTTLKVKNIRIVGKSWLMDVGISKNFKKYLVQKGSIAINGVSLTIAKVLEKSFQISIIPHTIKSTNLLKLKKNDTVNIEFDVLVKYVRKVLK
tara:strand:+ start:50 stop:634 length:585 start_codon:yes stop_codon:yes gene_type:complete